MNTTELKNIEIDAQEVFDFAIERGFKKYENAKFSLLFLTHLYLNHRYNNWDIYPIIDEIDYLEGFREKSFTKKESQFKHEPLKGLWKKHFSQAQFIPQNLLNAIKGKGFTKKWNKASEAAGNPERVTEEMFKHLAHNLVTGSYEEKASKGKITGEWIIFAKHEGKNHYLLLAPHDQEDEKILSSIKACCLKEMPFLSELL